MKWHRVYGIILRYMFLFRRSFDRLSDAFYWPTIDLLVWGLTGAYFQQLSSSTTAIVMIVAGILYWLILWRGQYEVTVNLLEDLWNKNLINIFVSPLKFSEWIVSFLLIGIIKAFFSFIFASLVAFVLYKVNIFNQGFYLIPFGLLLIMNGWWVGFFVAGLILRHGTRIQTLAWSMVALLSPFAGIYYPISVLPDWAQKVSMFVPASYIFEGSREVLQTGTLDPNKLVISFALNCVYLALSIYFLRISFNTVLQKGLVKVY